ncbi:hypothetical protein APTSU1_000249100 [Apodemus speciosus]|uniref:Uncharacterized protein n=1 Tax=Apodemus speciosus TaxID=105296 RepID=A0ABQ0EKF0_APOSI
MGTQDTQDDQPRDDITYSGLDLPTSIKTQTCLQ